MTTTNEWDDAARKASIDFQEVIDNSGDYLIEDGQKIISARFSDLREVHELLVELAVIMSKTIYFDRDTLVGEILANPLVVKAIERSKG